MGMIVVNQRGGDRARMRDYALMTHEMMVPIGTARAEPLALTDFNVLTFDGKAFPATDPLVAEISDTVRIRIGHLGPMDHHQICLHGNAFEVGATDRGTVPPSARVAVTSVLVRAGTVRVIEFPLRAARDWPLQWRMAQHAMNQMGDAVDMGGMFTVGKVRDRLATEDRTYPTRSRARSAKRAHLIFFGDGINP